VYKRQALGAAWADQARSPGSRALSFDQREKRIVAIQAQGHRDVSQTYIQAMLSPMLEQEFSAQLAERHMDELYTSGYFDMVSYSLEQLQGDRYKLIVKVREKPYSPHFFKTTLGFSTEVDGVTQFTVGAGYRRPWLTPSGLEFSLDARLGTQSELAARLHQPLSRGWSVETGAAWERNYLPLYRSAIFRDEQNNQKLAYFSQTVQSLDAQLVYDFERKANIKLGLTASAIRRTFDTTIDWTDAQLPSTDLVKYSGLKTQFQVDQLDSLSFPTQGYFWGGSLEQGVTGAIYSGGRLTAKWAHSVGPHIFNLGMHLAQDRVTRDCNNCRSPSQLILGGFQNMGAYRMGQLLSLIHI
jgi:NTE family protein